jgi:RHS repeat-associated protein
MTKGKGFKLSPNEVDQSGSHLLDFGSKSDQNASSTAATHQKIASSGSGKSGVVKTFTDFAGKSGDAFEGVFKEIGRVSKGAGDRLKTGSKATQQNESDVESSFKKINSPGESGKGSAPKGIHPNSGTSASGSGSSSGSQGHGSVTPPTIKGENGNPHQNDTSAADRTYCGDPIDVSTGRMMLPQTDVEILGALDLIVTRTHVSGYRLGRWFGTAWASTVDQRLEADETGVHLAVEDGRLLSYPVPPADGAVLPGVGARWPLRRVEGGYQVVDPAAERRYLFAERGGDRLPLVLVADGDGNQIELHYDPAGVLAELRHSGGHRIAVRTENGLITAFDLVGADGRQDLRLAEYRYDDQRRLVEVTNSSGRPMRFDYDAAGRIVRWEDRNGMWYGYRFDAEGRCVQATGKDGFLNVGLSYDQERQVTTSVNSLGHSTHYQLNDQLQVVAETDPLGNTTTFEWDPFDRLLSRTDPLGRTTHYGYDETGHVTEVTQPDGSRALAEYNEAGRWVSMVGPDGGVWRREYGAAEKLASEIDPLGAATTYHYDLAGNLDVITDAMGQTTRFTHDPSGRPVSVADANGAVTSYEYDPFGRPRTITDPLGGVLRLAWTPEGEVREQIEPDGAVWRSQQDPEGNTTEVVDAAQRRTRTTFGPFSEPIEEIAADGSRIGYAYDTELRLVSVTNEQGLVWRFRYDEADNLVEETDFNGRMLRYSYDAAGDLVGQTNGAGQTITIERDALGRIVRRGAPDDVAVFGYDPAGRMVLARNDSAEVTFGYDAAGRTVTQSINGRVVHSEFDRLGRRIRLRTPGGAETGWEYDALDRPTVLRTAGRVLRFDHDPLGRLVQRQLGGSTVLRQRWDAANRLAGQVVQAGGRVVQQRDYAYQVNGYLSAVRDALSGPRQLTIDDLGRVRAVQGPDWQERYGYDPAGNMVEAVWPTPVGTPAVGERSYAGTLLLSAGQLRYGHDAEGRTVSREMLSAQGARMWRYEWNADSRLVGVSTPDGQRWRYRYDALGRRVAKQRLDPVGAVLEQVEFSWDGAELIEQVRSGIGLRPIVTMWNWQPGADAPVSQLEWPLGAADRTDERFHAIVADLVGRPTELVDEAGALAWHANTTLWGAALPTRGTADTPLRFPGQYADSETGLHYNLHRYYDPETGRYLSHDPLGLDEGTETFAYVGNPTEWIDPLGLARTGCGANSGGASGSGGGGGAGKKTKSSSSKVVSGRVTKPGKTKAGSSSGTQAAASSDPRWTAKQKYRPGTYGGTSTEQKRVGNVFNTKVTGASHESEHPIGYAVLKQGSGLGNRTSSPQAKYVANHAPAYQEAEPAHDAHIGTDIKTEKHAGTSAFKSGDDYRDSQRAALTGQSYSGTPINGGKDAVSNAIQLNQLDYAHQQKFHDTTGKESGDIADNSYHHMVNSQEGHGIDYATAPGHNASTAPLDHTGAAELHLTRDIIRKGQVDDGAKTGDHYPSEDEISHALYPPPTAQQRAAQEAMDKNTDMGWKAGGWKDDSDKMDVDD